MRELIKKVLRENTLEIIESKRFTSYEMNDESFARVFEFFLNELKNNTGFSKSKMRRALTLTIRKWTEKPPQIISKTVLNHFILNHPNVNPYNARFRPRNRWGIDVIFEHTTPVNIFVTDLFKSKNIDDIRRVMNDYSGMSIITKEEDTCLHNKGFSRVRPQGWRQAYSDCDIDIMDENQFNIYKQEKLSNPDLLEYKLTEQPIPRSFWSYDTLKKEAEKYSNRTDFIRKSPTAYEVSKELGIYDEITQHMSKPKEWTVDELKAEAEKYNTITDFQTNSKGAYLKAYRLGILKDITKNYVTNKSPKLTKDDFIQKSNEVHNNYYDYSLVDFKNTRGKVDIICPKHGVFKQTAGNHLQGRGCPICRYEKSGSENRMTKDEFIVRSKEIHGDKFGYDKVIYKNSGTPVTISCPIHGDFKQTPSNHLRKSGCPSCRESKGELLVSKILDKMKVKYERQKKFVDCTNRKEGRGCRKLPFDFYLPEYNTVIEFDGEQHFKPVKLWGGEEKHINRLMYDRYKDEFTEKQNLRMIRVPYTMDVEEIPKFIKHSLNK